MMAYGNNDDYRTVCVEQHLRELRANARMDGQARQLRGRVPHALRSGLGRLLIAAGEALVTSPSEAACVRAESHGA